MLLFSSGLEMSLDLGKSVATAGNFSISRRKMQVMHEHKLGVHRIV